MLANRRALPNYCRHPALPLSQLLPSSGPVLVEEQHEPAAGLPGCKGVHWHGLHTQPHTPSTLSPPRATPAHLERCNADADLNRLEQRVSWSGEVRLPSAVHRKSHRARMVLVHLLIFGRVRTQGARIQYRRPADPGVIQGVRDAAITAKCQHHAPRAMASAST